MLQTIIPVKHRMGVSQIRGYRFRGPHNMDYGIWWSITGSPYFRKLPYDTSAHGIIHLNFAFRWILHYWGGNVSI